MELASDILVCIGTAIVIFALWMIWHPLGLLAFGLAMVALGFVFHVRALRTKAQGKARA